MRPPSVADRIILAHPASGNIVSTRVGQHVEHDEIPHSLRSVHIDVAITKTVENCRSMVRSRNPDGRVAVDEALTEKFRDSRKSVASSPQNRTA